MSCIANFTANRSIIAAVAREKKLLVLREILGSDINRLTALLLQICEDRRDYRDYTRHELHEAVRELVGVVSRFTGPTCRPRRGAFQIPTRRLSGRR